MHTGRHYSLKEVSTWTRRETAVFLVVASVPVLLYQLAGWTWLTLPWLPIALVGTAVAFITGFKNNASYARMWEARQIWGGIVNDSRAWAASALDFVGAGRPDDSAAQEEARAAQHRLVRRHIAWMTALRFQLRQQRPWENMQRRHNVEYRAHYRVPEWQGKLEDELALFLDDAERTEVLGKTNRAAQLLALQSRDLRRLADAGLLTEHRHTAMERIVGVLFTHQGKSERIKNFPYPRQFATLNLFFVWLFVLLTPLGLMGEFQKLGGAFVWVAIPAGVVVAWVFHTMDKIGESSENPFEGGPNDIPITSMSRTIEIDLLEMLGEPEIPEPIGAENNILM